MTYAHRAHRWHVAAAAGMGLALLGGLVTAGPAAAAGTAPVLSPTSGPVGTRITVSGSCGTADPGMWLSVRFRLYYPDAFETAGGPEGFAETTGEIASSGAYVGDITVPAKATYVTKGPGPAMPGPEVTKPVTGTIRVVALCNSDASAYPWNDLAQSWTAFSVQSATRVLVSTAKPAISGKPKVGKRLKASTGSWSPAATSYAYQWYRGKKEIAGKKAERKRYKVVAADRGKRLKVKVTASRAGYASASAISKRVKIKR